WIDEGADWFEDPASASAEPVGSKSTVTEEGRRFWAFQPVRKVAPPAVKNRDWPRGVIDRFILAKLEEKRLPPVRDADRAVLLRRLMFDLVGLPPSWEEVQAFQSDESPDAVERVVDR